MLQLRKQPLSLSPELQRSAECLSGVHQTWKRKRYYFSSVRLMNPSVGLTQFHPPVAGCSQSWRILACSQNKNHVQQTPPRKEGKPCKGEVQPLS